MCGSSSSSTPQQQQVASRCITLVITPLAHHGDHHAGLGELVQQSGYHSRAGQSCGGGHFPLVSAQCAGQAVGRRLDHLHGVGGWGTEGAAVGRSVGECPHELAAQCCEASGQ